MSFANLLSPGTVERLGWMLVHFLWQTAVVALLLAMMLRLLRRAGANLRYIVSCLALTLILMLPVVTIRFIDVSGPVAEPGPLPPVSLPVTTPVQVPQVAQELSAFAEAPAPMKVVDLTAATSWPERVASALEPALPYLVFGWLTGVFGLSAWHLGGWAQLQRLKRRMVYEVGHALQEKLGGLGARLGVPRAVTLLESALVEVPTVVGWLRPVILLPASALTGLSPEQLEAILAHELAHIRRYDYLVNILQTVVEILGFYHPAVWWVSQRIRIERENCCDDLAVLICGDSVRYAKALTHLEEIRHSRAELAVAATGGSLVNRVARLLGRPAVDDRRFAWLPGLLALLLVTITLIPTAFVLGAAGPQQTGESSNHAVADDVNNVPNPSGAERNSNAGVRVRTDTGSEDAPPTEEKTSVQLEFTVAKVLSDVPMDRETTVMILNILGGTMPVAGSCQVLTMTANEVLRKYVAGRQLPPETARALTHLLRSRGYIEIEASPQVLTRDGVEAKIQVGEKVPVPVPAKGTGSPQAPSFEYIECGTAIQVTAHVHNPDVVTLEMAVELTDVPPSPPHEQIPLVRRRAIESTLTISTDRYFSLLVEPQQSETGEAQNEEPVLVMVKPSILRRDAETSAPSTSPQATQPTAMPRPGETGTTNSGAPSLLGVLAQIAERTGTKIEVDTTVKPVFVWAPPDWANTSSAETALLTILQNTPYTYQTVGPNAYLVFKPITGSFSGDLRTTLQNLSILAEVPIIPDANVTGEVHADIRARPLDKALEMVLASTPYVVKKTSRYYLVVDRNMRNFIDPPLIETRTIRLNVITPTYARGLLPAAMQQYVDAAPATPSHYRGILTVTAPPTVADQIMEAIRRLDVRPRQLLLAARVVAIEHSDLLSLGIKWVKPSPGAGTFPGSTAVNGDSTDDAWARKIWIGSTSDRTSTDSLLTALDGLEKDHRLQVVSHPQTLLNEGREYRPRAVQGEWYGFTVSKSDIICDSELSKLAYGPGLSIVPRIGDNNEITLETAIKAHGSAPQGPGSNPADEEQFAPQNVLTIQNGDTVVWAGLEPEKATVERKEKRVPILGDLPLVGPLFRSNADKPPRELALFVTVYLIRDLH